MNEGYRDLKFIDRHVEFIDKIVGRNNFQFDDKWIDILQMLEQQPIQSVITLQSQKLLLPLLKGLSAYCKKKGSQVNHIVNKLVFTMYDHCYQCFLKHENSLRGYFQEGVLRKLINDRENGKSIIKTSRNAMFQNLFDTFYNIRKINIFSEMRRKLNIYIEQFLLTVEPQSYREEVSLNWLKIQVQILQDQSNSYLCCKIHFVKGQRSDLVSGFNQTFNQQFKDYRLPLDNESIRFHLTKTVVGFLNTSGGIIYVGMKEDKNKLVEVKGVELSRKQKYNFLMFMHQTITKEIYPKSKQRQNYQNEFKENKQSQYWQKLEKEFMKNKMDMKSSEYRIDDSVSVDFMDIYDEKTMINARENIEKTDRRFYIVRIKIKMGNPKELYHVISATKHVPEAYLREDKSVKKKDMKEFYDIYLKRLSGDKSSFVFDRSDKHSFCRFIPTPTIRKQ